VTWSSGGISPRAPQDKSHYRVERVEQRETERDPLSARLAELSM
jgi:hypothetical protein